MMRSTRFQYSESIVRLRRWKVVSRCESVQQEQTRLEPIAFDGPGCAAEHLGYFTRANPAKEAELDDLAQSFVDAAELCERFVDGDDLVELHLEKRVVIAQRHARDGASALRRPSPAREVDEHLSHRARRSAEKMCVSLPATLVAFELEKRLVNELGRRERRQLSLSQM